jgi:transposase
MVSTMKIADTKVSTPGEAGRVRTNRTGRRTYSREYKLEIVEECSVPGASVAAISLAHRINANVVRRWIVQHRGGVLYPSVKATPAMLPITLAATGKLPTVAAGAVTASGSKPSSVGVIEIELEGARIWVRGVVDGRALRVVLETLAQR